VTMAREFLLLVITIQVEDIEIRSIMKLDRNRSCKLVLGEIKGDEIRKPLTKLLGNAPRKTFEREPSSSYSHRTLFHMETRLETHLLKKRNLQHFVIIVDPARNSHKITNKSLCSRTTRCSGYLEGPN